MAVDKRVAGGVPIVMPIGNMVPNINHQYQLYGGWSFTLSAYTSEGCIGFLNSPRFKNLSDVIDPLVYFPRFANMPKFVISTTGDEFFPPDSPQFFWDKLPGPRLLNVVPNAEHFLITGIIDVSLGVSAFVHLVESGIALPIVDWTLLKSNGTSVSGHPATITATVDAAALPYLMAVQMWKATTSGTTKRDFRLIRCEDVLNTSSGCLNAVFWWPTTLQSTSSPGVYVAESNVPALGGWSAFVIQFIFEYYDMFVGYNRTLTVTTELNVVPDVLPFAPCPPSECACEAKCPPPPPPASPFEPLRKRTPSLRKEKKY